MSAAPTTLSKEHREILHESCISDQVIDARGYVTVTEEHGEWLQEVAGFGETAASRVPAILIPVFRTDGELHGYSMRPDVPFVDKRGKVRKYEKPSKSSNVLDVHPFVKRLTDPEINLIIAEGSKKGDALVKIGLTAVSINGAWGWRTTTASKGKINLPEFGDLALNDGRTVYLCPDSDYETNSNVRSGWDNLRYYLERKGAKVEIIVPPERGDGEKMGVDDWLATGQTWGDLVKANALRNLKGKMEEADEPAPPTLEECYEKCWRIAQSQDVLQLLADELHNTGLVGEDRLAKLTYLTFASAATDKPCNQSTTAQSSTGKSYNTDRTAALFPPEFVKPITSGSMKSLIYAEEGSLSNVCIYMAEAAGLGNTEDGDNYYAQTLRSLLSEGRLRYEVTVADQSARGGYRVDTIVQPGPTGLVVTTTALALDNELETRLIKVSADESIEQTREILRAQFDAAAGRTETELDVEPWHAFARWIRLGERRVVVPFAAQIATGIADHGAVRLRRDVPQMLSYVKTHALLHRENRERDEDGRIIATIADYAAVYALVHDLIATTAGSAVHERVHKIVGHVVDVIEAKEKKRKRPIDDFEDHATITDLHKASHDSKATVKRHAAEALELGHLRDVGTGKPRAAKLLVLGEPLPPKEATLLPSPDSLSEPVSECELVDEPVNSASVNGSRASSSLAHESEEKEGSSGDDLLALANEHEDEAPLSPSQNGEPVSQMGANPHEQRDSLAHSLAHARSLAHDADEPVSGNGKLSHDYAGYVE
jgi:hypothetical protein